MDRQTWTISLLLVLTATTAGRLSTRDSVVFFHHSSVSLSSASWTLSYFIDFNELTDTLQNYDTLLQTVKDITDKTIVQQSKIELYKNFNLPIRQLTLQVNHLNQTKNKFEKHLQSFQALHKISRKKRSLIPFIGDLANSLFGISTDSELENIKRSAQALRNNQKEITHVVNSSLTLIKHNSQNIVTNRKHLIQLKTTIKSLITQINNFNNRSSFVVQTLAVKIKIYLELTQAIQHSRQVLHDISLIFHRLTLTIDMLTSQTFSPSVVRPDKLRNILKEIRKHLPKTLKLPVNPDKNIWPFYKMMTVDAHIHNVTIFLILKIPLINFAEEFDIIKVFNMPIPNPIFNNILKNKQLNSLTARYQIETDYIIINKARDHYIIPSTNEIHSCLSSPSKFCPIKSPLYPTHTPRFCVVALFTNTQVESICKVKVYSNIKLPIANHITKGIWILATDEKLKFHINCEKENKIKTITASPPLEIIKINESCSAYSHLIKLPRFYEYSSKIAETISVPSLNLTIPKIWQPKLEIPSPIEISKLSVSDLSEINDIDINELRQSLSSLDNQEYDPKTTTIISCVILTSILCVTIISYLLFKHVKKNEAPNNVTEKADIEDKQKEPEHEPEKIKPKSFFLK